ncbi:FtsX-like permease family protein [Paenibacillus sepulcri]|uniref:ABC transporter permease n=1 Tax=Paenibacillus sepulcri TaxID=359917 RepID=A0ABS7CDQ5_9BACL|nr:hypothetical protein [Paenibacillus sepulcri]
MYFTIVVSDEMYAKLKTKSPATTVEAYGITRQDNAKPLTQELEGILPEKANFTSFYSDYSLGMQSTGLIMFMGGFLGLVFLAATGSIIYFKQLTEANSDKARYRILYQIGFNKKEIRRAVAKQVRFIFALPLVAGIAHCAAALSAVSHLMQSGLAIPVAICMGVYTCIYLIYYLFTVNAYCRIVTNFN